MEYDVWFCKYEDHLYVAPCLPGEPPMDPPKRMRAGDTVGKLLTRVKQQGNKIVQVGILPPEMMGLDIEV